MSPLGTQPDLRVFAAKVATDALVFGQHNIFVRNGLVLNDHSSLECYWVDDPTGFDSADVQVSATPNVQEEGELPDPGQHGGRTMTLSGWIQAGSLPKIHRMARDLLDSCLDLVETPLLITTNPASTFFTQPDVFIDCRPADKPMISMKAQPADLSGLLKRPFTVALHATRPAYRETTLQHAQIIPVSVDQLGRLYPRTYDLYYNVPLDPQGNPATGFNTVTVFQAGNWSAKPKIRFNGAMNDARLENLTTGQIIRLRHAVASGDYIDIDVYTGDITDSNGQDASSYFDPSSDWMEFVGARYPNSGDNDIILSVSYYDAGASVDLWWQNTSL